MYRRFGKTAAFVFRNEEYVQKKVIFVIAAVRTSNLTRHYKAPHVISLIAHWNNLGYKYFQMLAILFFIRKTYHDSAI
jgi:hypothetical protein